MQQEDSFKITNKNKNKIKKSNFLYKKLKQKNFLKI